MFLNSHLIKESLLTWEDWEELNFTDICTFLRHVEATSTEVYNSVMRFQKHLMLLNKQSRKLEKKLTNYKKANKTYVIKNKQLKTKNRDLKTQLANLEKQLEIARLDKRLTPLSLPSPPFSASPPPLASVFDDSNGKSKYFHHSHHSCKTKLIKLPDLLMLMDGNAVKFDIDV